jgi:hypothetical protein
MAQKRIDIKFNVDDKSVKIAGEETMKLSQQVRLLKAELASGKYSQEEFEILASKLGDVEDQMAKTKTRSGDLLTSLQLIPGPIGEIASKFNGAVALLKQFSGFSLKDLKFQFKETLNDVKDIGKSLADATGLSALFGKSVQATQEGFSAVQDGVKGATTQVGNFRKALITTGIGAIVVAVGLIVAYWEDIVGLVNGVSSEQEELNALTQENLDIENKKLKDLDAQSNQLKLQGKTEKEILQLKIQQSNQAILAAEAAVQQAEITKKAQVEASQRNKDILSGLLNFISFPLTAILGSIDLISQGLKELGVIDEALSLREQTFDYLASFVFDPEEVSKEAEATVVAQKDGLNALKEQNAGFQLAIQEIDKGAAEKSAANTKENNDKKLEAEKILADASLQLKSKQAQEEAAVEADYQAKLKKLKEAGIADDGNLEKLRDAKIKEIRDKVAADEEKLRQEKLKKEQDLQNQLRKIETSRTQTLMDDAQLEIDIVNQKYAALIAAAKANNEEFKTLEALQAAEIEKIRTDATLKENERLAANAEKTKQDNLKLLQDEQAYEQSRLAMKTQALDGIIQLAGAETAVGRAALIAKQILLAKELVLEVKRTIAFSKAALARSQAAVAAGTAQTAQIGFPQNLIPLALYAVQAAGIISAIVSATKKSESLTPDIGGLEGGTSTPPLPSAPAPVGVVARRNQGGFVYGDGGSITDSIPAMLSNGEFIMNAKSASMFSPMLTAMNDVGNLPNIGVPQSLGNQSLVDVMSQGMNNRPIKTYVTAQDMSNQQQFDRTIKSRSLI